MFRHMFYLHIQSIFLTFEACIGIAIFTIVPFSPDFLGRWCFFIIFKPSTITLFSWGIARTILPDLPLSLPVIIFTLSPFFNFIASLLINSDKFLINSDSYRR